MLLAENMEVTLAETGKGDRTNQLNSFDCIILDYSLPDMSGHQLQKVNESKNKMTPVIIYSARDFNKRSCKILAGIRILCF
jgi:DNA-binding response OmpR family regulator